jgi:hypothetical protein
MYISASLYRPIQTLFIKYFRLWCDSQRIIQTTHTRTRTRTRARARAHAHAHAHARVCVCVCVCMYRNRSSLVSTVSGCGLDARAIEVRSPAEARGFFFYLTSVSWLALELTQPPIQWVLGVLSPGVKRGRGVTLTTNLHLEPRSWMSRSYTSSPPAPT